MLSLFRAISAILGGNIFYNFSLSLIMTMFFSMIWLYEVSALIIPITYYKNIVFFRISCSISLIFCLYRNDITSTVFYRISFLFQIISNAIYPRTIYPNPLENLKDEKNSWPQLFIYSKKDNLIPFQVSYKFLFSCSVTYSPGF